METSIEVKTSQGDLIKGILIKETEEYLTIKISSGYNANILKKNCEILKQEKETKLKKESKRIAKDVKTNSKLPKISLLHTGGTIASKVDYETGAVSNKFTAEELLKLYPEFNKLANITPIMIGNFSSEDMRFAHFNILLNEIKTQIENGCDAIFITHGTDTLHYTSAALHYALKNSPVPIILIGSQRSSDRPSSDGYLHLKSSFTYISQTFKNKELFRGVGICMHSNGSDESSTIYRGINVRKAHSSKRDAFKQFNEKEFCIISKTGKIDIKRNDLLSEKPKNNVSITEYNTELKVGFFKSHPQVFPEEIKVLSFYDAVIIEATGLGHLPINEFDKDSKINLKNLDAITELTTKTKVIIGVQTGEGTTNMNVYSAGTRLKETGVLGDGMTLTTETLFLRAAFCLSQKETTFENMWERILE